MPYVKSDGTVVEKRTWFRISLISDIFWGVIDTFGLFFSTLINPARPIPHVRRSSASRGGAATGGNSSSRPRGGANIRTLPKNSCNPRG